MFRFLLLIFCGFSLFSCSLTYDSEEPQVSHIPELVFSDARFVSYEDGRISMMLETALLEQYQEDSSFYGSQVRFITYNKDGDKSAEGHCQMISANDGEDIYSLLGSVEIESFEENVLLQAESVSWNGQTEQLITGNSETISIRKGNSEEEGRSSNKIEMKGRSFSASGLTMEFQFAGPVSGTISTSNEKEE